VVVVVVELEVLELVVLELVDELVVVSWVAMALLISAITSLSFGDRTLVQP
jgi:hypothetical protein